MHNVINFILFYKSVSIYDFYHFVKVYTYFKSLIRAMKNI